MQRAATSTPNDLVPRIGSGEDWTVYQGPFPDPGQPPYRSKRTKTAVITSRSSGTE